MSVLGDITSGWTKKTPSNTDTEGNPPQAGSVAKQVASEYDASAGNNATVSGIVPTSNADGTVNTVENKPVYNVKEDAASKYNLVNQINNSQPVVSPQPTEPAAQTSYTSPVDNFIKNYTPESEQQKALREKRERRNKLFTSIADGLSAITNIAGATGGAKNANPNNISLTKAYQSRLDQFKQARKENEQKYLYYLQKKDEAKRQADAAAWDRTKFTTDYNFKVGESQRDQSNKDWEHDHTVEQDKIIAALKAKGIDIDEKTLKELIRHNTASEGIGSVNAQANMINATKPDSRKSYEGPEYGTGVNPINAKSIMIPNHDKTVTTYYYDKNLDQALMGHKNDMLSIAKRLKDRYTKNGNEQMAQYYRNVIRDLTSSTSREQTISTIVQNIPRFPQLGDAVKKTLRIGENTSIPPKKTNSTPSTHSGKKGFSNTKALGL